MPIYKEDYNPPFSISIRHIPTNSGYMDMASSEEHTPKKAIRDIFRNPIFKQKIYEFVIDATEDLPTNFNDFEFIVRHIEERTYCADFRQGNMPELEGDRVLFLAR